MINLTWITEQNNKTVIIKKLSGLNWMGRITKKNSSLKLSDTQYEVLKNGLTFKDAKIDTRNWQ